MFRSTLPSHNFAVSNKKVYHKGLEIGYLDSIKLEKQGDKVKHKYSFILFNTSENYSLAPYLFNYLNNHDALKGVDLEIKVIISE
jgi:hypothetical protein